MRPSALLLEIREDLSRILKIPFTEKIDHGAFKREQKILALWAADCADAENILECILRNVYG